MFKSRVKKQAFTLAEVLITLIVIGVIAAITVPTLMNNYRKQQYVAGLKKAYSAIGNGFKLYIAKEGVTGIQESTMWKGVIQFFNDGTGFDIFQQEFNKVFNSIQSRLIDENDESAIKYGGLQNSGSPSSIISIQENLNDGSILYIMPYPLNLAQMDRTEEQLKQLGAKHTSLYAEIYVDVNGEAKPNIFGRDMFYFILTEDGTLLPGGSKQVQILRWGTNNGGWQDTQSADFSCTIANGNWVDGYGCAARIIEEGWEMKY